MRVTGMDTTSKFPVTLSSPNTVKEYRKSHNTHAPVQQMTMLWSTSIRSKQLKTLNACLCHLVLPQEWPSTVLRGGLGEHSPCYDPS